MKKGSKIYKDEVVVTVRMPKRLREGLKKSAAAWPMSLNSYIVNALNKYMSPDKNHPSL
jgi:predicted HicB family RNase H-like nuclease